MCQELFQKDIPNLLMCASARIERLGERLIFEPLGLSSISFKILAIIGHLGPVQPNSLVKMTGSTKSNITQRLNYLEKKSLIVRQAPTPDSDRRTTSFALSDAGRDLLTRASKDISQKKLHFEKAFSEEEQRIFLKLLDKLNNKILQEYESCIKQIDESVSKARI